MKRYLVAFVLITSILESWAVAKKNPPKPPAPVPITSLSLQAANWKQSGTWYKGNAPLSNVNNVLTFTFPQTSSSSFVGYLTTSPKVPSSISGTLTVNLSIITTGTPNWNYKSQPDNTCDVAASVRPFLWAANNTNATTSRWWSNPTAYTLAAGVATVSVPLTPDRWSDVDGSMGNANPTTQAGFKATLASIGSIGVTFGGGCFFGHGVNVNGGTGQFFISGYTMK